MAAVSVICLRPCASITASALALPDHIVPNTTLATLPEIVWSEMRSSSPPNCFGGTLEEVMSRPCLLSVAASSPMTQLAASFAHLAAASGSLGPSAATFS